MYRITGRCDEVPATVVTITDGLHREVPEDRRHQHAHTATLEALDGATSAAALCLTSAFRASVADLHRPYATKKLLLWRYVSESRLKDLMQRLSVLATPAVIEQVDRESTAMSHIQKVADELEPYPVMPHKPIGPAMRMRGEVILRIFTGLVEALISENANRA